MERPDYLQNYIYDWETMKIILTGMSVMDSKYFISTMDNLDQVNLFLSSYGVDPNDPISKAELFGNFQEALQFIRRYFLKEGSPDGLDISIPNSLYMIHDIGDLFLMATSGANHDQYSREDQLWAEVVLKIMHTLLHVDKDLRAGYFNVIQTQIFDRLYKYIYRDNDDNLFLGVKGQGEGIPLLDFQTKAKKTRESVVIKLLHKAENVAEELFDRVGVRFITKSKLDTVNAIKFMLEHNIVIPHNIKPSRSFNSLVDVDNFKKAHGKILKEALKDGYTEEEFRNKLDEALGGGPSETIGEARNKHSSSKYLAIQFTCRQLIKYQNPFVNSFNSLRTAAKEAGDENTLAKKILSMDHSLISRDIRFFYPFEVQIMDEDSHLNNTQGEASHEEYKKAQTTSAMKRIFSKLIEYKGLDL